MDRRSWPWRKRSSERIISTVEHGDALPTQKACEEQDVKGKVLENSDETESPLVLVNKVKGLNEKLSASLAESNAKDDLVRHLSKDAEEAVSGWETAKAEAISLKQELESALQQRYAAEDRVSHLDGALKECMQHLRFVREEKEQAIHDAVMKKARELDVIRIELEGNLAETRERLIEADAENSAIHKSLQEAIRSAEELKEGKTQVEAEVNILQIRLSSLEEENAAVKYELRVLEKELEIRNEEREYNRKSADAANRQHLESMKKIAKLETECQRLRILVRKKLPGPAAVAQMKTEVEILAKDTAEWKRKKLHANRGGFSVGSALGEPAHVSAQETSIKQINILSERLLSMEEDNEILKRTLEKRNNELQVSRVTCARTANKLSHVESQLDALCRGHGIGRINGMAIDGHVEFSKGTSMSYEPSLASISEDGGNEDEASCAESWASALISELSHFKKEKPGMLSNKVIGSPDFNLMDDFIEMEQLATVSSNEIAESAIVSGKSEVQSQGPIEVKIDQNSNAIPMMEKKGALEVVPAERETELLVTDKHTTCDQQFSTLQSRNLANEVALSSSEELLHMILDAHAKGQRLDGVLEKVKATIPKSQHYDAEKINKIKEKLSCLKVLNSDGLNNSSQEGVMSGQFSPKYLSEGNSSEDETGPFTTSKRNKRYSNCSRLNASIHKIMGLVEGFFHSSCADNAHSESTPFAASGSLPFENSTSVPGYTMRVLQWQNSELDSIIQSLVKVCSNLIQGKAQIVEFVEEVGSALDWLVNHFFSLQDVSTMRATIKKQLEWDGESHSDSESEAPAANAPTFGQENSNKMEKEKYENKSLISTLDIGDFESNSVANSFNKLGEAQNISSEKETLEYQLNEEISKLKNELNIIQSEKQELEGMFQVASNNLEALKAQLLESEKKVADLQTELTATKELKQLREDQFENQVSLNEELEFQLKAAQAEINKFKEKYTSLQAEFEEKGSCFQELETTCLDLQLQLESRHKPDTSRDGKMPALHYADEDEIRARKERDISAATKKLSECQQTILALEKQLKVLAAPSDVKDFSFQSSSGSPSLEKNTPSRNQRASLFDHMQAESTTEESQECPPESPKPKEVLYPRAENDENSQQESHTPRKSKSGLLYGSQILTDSPNVDAHKHVQNHTSGDNSHADSNTTSTTSPAKFFSMKKNSSANESSSAGAIEPYSAKKRSRAGGFSRFLMRTKKGH